MKEAFFDTIEDMKEFACFVWESGSQVYAMNTQKKSVKYKGWL